MSQTFGLVHSLRGIAATWVLLFHASEGRHIDQVKASIPAWSHSLFELGDNGVAIFFVLSGYVIAHSLRDREVTASYLGRFALRRSIRLDPPLWASIALVIIFAALSSKVKGEIWTAPTFGQVVSNATYTQIFIGYPSINTVYWTLCYEVQFYLALCLWLMLAQRAKVIAYCSMFGVAVAFGGGIVTSPVAGLFVDLWHCFFLGALAYWAHHGRMALVAFVLLNAILALSNPNVFTQFCMMTSVALFVARKTGLMDNGLSWRPLTFLGTVSYSLYLTHNPISGASFFLLAKAGASQLAALFVTLAVCVAAAYLFWLLIERPSMNLAHKIKLQASQTPSSQTDVATLAPAP